MQVRINSLDMIKTQRVKLALLGLSDKFKAIRRIDGPRCATCTFNFHRGYVCVLLCYVCVCVCVLRRKKEKCNQAEQYKIARNEGLSWCYRVTRNAIIPCLFRCYKVHHKIPKGVLSSGYLPKNRFGPLKATPCAPNAWKRIVQCKKDSAEVLLAPPWGPPKSPTWLQFVSPYRSPCARAREADEDLHMDLILRHLGHLPEHQKYWFRYRGL